ncbi:sensor domain-containing diguanylate cyclase [Shewanella aegiceratis]|uniref:sensor domain-containing diguanylate cyclase n=1 Tax=Shewanella aegiceratis TaxID=2864203 RepID=UPI001C65DDA8|nr:diguanylate cyclase [Shewanella aegiceratis]QYJ82021.1 diguanylate cyclase [Shewanella aegiceratis]
MSPFKLLLLLITLSFPGFSLGESLLAVNKNQSIELASWLYYVQDDSLTSLEQVSKLSSSHWQRLTPEFNQHLGVEPFWVKISLYNATDTQMRRYFKLGNPHLNRVSLFHLQTGKPTVHLEMGDSYPFSQRPIINNDFLYRFELAPEVVHTFYIRVDTEGSANLPISLLSPDHIVKATETQSLYQGFQLGALMAIGLFSLFIALTSRSYSYSYYSGYVLSVTLLVASLHGLSFRYLWPNWPVLQAVMIPILIPIALTFVLMFSEKVLQLKYHNLKMLRLCRYSAATGLFLTLVTPFLSYSVALKVNIVAVLITTSMLMLIALLLSLRGHKLARLYTFAWSGMLIGSFVTAMMYLGVIYLPIMHQTPIMVGLSFEIVFMAAVLAIRYNDERKAKLKIQQEALLQAQRIRQAREEALQVEADSNERLEQMVQERTLELEIALRELNEANQKLTEQNTVDSLTGVKNRAAFEKRLQAEGRLSRRQQTPLAILMIDIDRFKAINDTYGHLAGDQALKTIAQALKEKLRRPSDLVSRFGGEEFAMILPNTSCDGALQVAELMRSTVCELPLAWGEQAIPLTISIGICAEVIVDDQHTQLLVDQADKALYRAKHEGRNRVCVYSPELEE